MRISVVYAAHRIPQSTRPSSQGCIAIKHLCKTSELVGCVNMINMRFSFAVCKLNELVSSMGIWICFVQRFYTEGLTLCYCAAQTLMRGLCTHFTTCFSLCLFAKYFNNDCHVILKSAFEIACSLKFRMLHANSKQKSQWSLFIQQIIAIRFHVFQQAGIATYLLYLYDIGS